MRLAVYCDGSCVVTVPKSMSDNLIEKFIVEKSQWIINKIDLKQKIEDIKQHIREVEKSTKEAGKEIVRNLGLPPGSKVKWGQDVYQG